MLNDEKWMKLAIQEAKKAENIGEVPVGAIIVKDDLIISRGHNHLISISDPTAHAEIQAIRSAGLFLKNYRMTELTLYVTLEPCVMCLGAIMNARIKRLVYGAFDPKTGVCGSCENLTNAKFFNHKLLIEGGILEGDCKKLLQKFFRDKRKNRKLNYNP